MFSLSDKHKFLLVNSLTIFITLAWIVFLYDGLGSFMNLERSIASVKLLMENFFWNVGITFLMPISIIGLIYKLFSNYKTHGYEKLKVIIFDHFKEILVFTVVIFIPILINKSYLIVFFPICSIISLPVWTYLALLKII